MDIAHLKEQYNWIKEKQKLQTHVVLFKKAPNNEDICGKSLVNMVPVSQEVGSPKSFEEQMPIMKVAFNFVDDPDSGQTPWRTHLGIHRMTRTGKWIKASNTHISTAINNPTTNPTNAKDVSVECCEHPHVEPIASEKLNGPRCHDSGDKGEDVASANRKCSSTEAFSKPFSVAAHRSSQPSLNSHYYPFPQRKCPKKSEAARRLGMYS